MSETARSSTAHELAPGRLSSFEDADAPVSLEGLLPPRRAAGTITFPAPTPPPLIATVTPASDDITSSPPTPSSRSASRGGQAGNGSHKRETRRPDAEAPARRSSPVRRTRPSVVHIPASLIPRVTAARASSGRSNGELVIAALEQAHARLGELMGERTGTGGTLFATRASRPGRATDGPLTALNIRLYDDDYAVIDQLVEKSGASSRGQLVSVALTDYLRD